MSPLKFSLSYSEVTIPLYLTALKQGEHGNKSEFVDVNMLPKGLSALESAINKMYICIAEPTKFNSQSRMPSFEIRVTLQHVNSSSCQNQTKTEQKKHLQTLH